MFLSKINVNFNETTLTQFFFSGATATATPPSTTSEINTTLPAIDTSTSPNDKKSTGELSNEGRINFSWNLL